MDIARGRKTTSARLAAAALILAVILVCVPLPVAISAPSGSQASNLRSRAPVTDLGFKPDQNGFNFENYGSDSGARNLTEAQVRALFGDEACCMSVSGKLVLTPTAKQWMEQVNGMMGEGHCEGMAALSLLFFTGQEDIEEYGADIAYDLSFEDEDLQKDIARWFATQALEPTQSSVIEGAPTEILQALSEMSKSGETYTLGIYKSDGSGGHAITPYSVVDDGGGKFRIMVYDNNYPGKARAVNVDANTNSWSYEASINPEEESELYEGNAETRTLEITPTSARLETQSAPFALSGGGPAYASLGLSAQPRGKYNQLFLDGKGHVLISDEEGRELGYRDGKLVNEIPGAMYTRVKAADGGNAGPEPIYWLPQKATVSAAIDGTGLKEESPTDLVIIGPGFATGVEGIKLEPGQTDTVVFDPTDQAVSYETDRTASPNFVAAVEEKGDVGYYFEIQGAQMEGGGTLTAVLDTREKDLLLNTEKLKNEGTFSLLMTRVSSEEEEELLAEDLKLPAGALIYVNYGEWTGSKSTVQLGVDLDGDGNVDDVYEAQGEDPTADGGIPAYVWAIIVGAVILVAAFVVALITRQRLPGEDGGSGEDGPS